MFRIISVALLMLATTNSAYAYLDPGAGSFVLQLLAAGLLAAGASVKMFWHRIKQFASELLRSDKRPTGNP